ncbi:MAG: MFS transporter, partial [Oscillospiraceae bacterium]
MSTIDKKFSGWSVVAGCFLMSFFVNAIVGNTTSLFMAPICQQFGFDTGSYSLVTLFGALATAVAAMLLAPLLKDKNIKLVMMACVAVTGISFAVMGLCTKLWQFILVFAVSSAGLAGVSNLPIAMMVTAWFNDYRSTAMSIGFSGCSLGASFWSILFGKIISDGGWTTCYFLGGTLVAVMGLIIIPIFMKKSPQMYGQQPYISATPNNQSSKKSHGHEWLGLSKKEALKTPYFLILSIIVILIGSLYTGVITHAVNYLVSIGWDITAASTVLSLYSLVSIAGVFAGGLIFDKLGLRIGTLLSVI